MDIKKEKTSNSKKKDKRLAVEGAVKTTIVNIVIHYFYYLIILVIVITLAGGYFILLRPKINSLLKQKEVEEEIIAEYSKELDAYNNKINNLQTKLDSYAGVKDTDIERINKFLPEEPKEKELFIQINNIVRNNGLILGAMSISGEDKKRERRTVVETVKEEITDGEAKVVEVNINVDVAGINYYSLKSLLNSLENNLRLFDVQAASYSPGSMGTNIVLKTYYLKK